MFTVQELNGLIRNNNWVLKDSYEYRVYILVQKDKDYMKSGPFNLTPDEFDDLESLLKQG